MAKHSFPRRIFTFNSEALRGYNAGYSGTALPPQYVGQGRSFNAYRQAISNHNGYNIIDAMDNNADGVLASGDGLIVASGGDIYLARYV